MFNLGPFELVAIFVVALLVFGPDKLPEMGKQVGRAVKEFRKFQASMQENVRDVMEPITGPIIPNGPGGQFGNPTPTNVSGGNIPRSATVQNPEPPDGEAAGPPGTFGHYAPVEPPATPADAPAESAPAAPVESPAPAQGEATPADGHPPAAGWARPGGEASPPASPAEPDAG